MSYCFIVLKVQFYTRSTEGHEKALFILFDIMSMINELVPITKAHVVFGFHELFWNGENRNQL